MRYQGITISPWEGTFDVRIAQELPTGGIMEKQHSLLISRMF